MLKLKCSMKLALRPVLKLSVEAAESREPSQQRRAPRRDPRRDEIPMRPNARPEGAFPLIEGDVYKYRLRKND